MKNYHLTKQTKKTSPTYIACRKANNGCEQTSHITEVEYMALAYQKSPLVKEAQWGLFQEPLSTKNICFFMKLHSKWNKRADKTGSRKSNLSAEVTESIVAHCIDAKLIRGKSGDLMKEDGMIIEVKASAGKGPSSFSPSSIFDNLYFALYTASEKTFKIYDLNRNRDSLNTIIMSAKDAVTFETQSKGQRRPRFSILKEIVNKENLLPSYSVKVHKTMEIVSLSS